MKRWVSLICKRKSVHVPQDEEECLLGTGTETSAKNGRLNVRVLVQKLHALLQTIKAALKATNHRLGNTRIHLLGLFLQIRQKRPNHLDDGDEERTKGGRTAVVPQGYSNGLDDRAGSNVCLFAGEVPFGDGQGENDFAEGDDELRRLEETKEYIPSAFEHKVAEFEISDL